MKLDVFFAKKKEKKEDSYSYEKREHIFDWFLRYLRYVWVSLRISPCRLNNQFVGYDIKHAATTYLDVILTQYNQTIPYELSENLI